MPITAKSVSPDGTAQTNPVLIPACRSARRLSYFTMCEKHATIFNGKLILFIDEALELPFDPNGLDMVVQPDWLQKRGWWQA